MLPYKMALFESIVVLTVSMLRLQGDQLRPDILKQKIWDWLQGGRGGYQGDFCQGAACRRRQWDSCSLCTAATPHQYLSRLRI